MKKFYKENKFFVNSTVLLFGLNAFCYFIIKLFINNYHLLASPLDDKIPFLPGFIWIYMLWYPFLIISFYFIYKYHKERYQKILFISVISLLILYGFFIFYPTMVNRPDVALNGTLTNLFTKFIFMCDKPVNCFPSGHCLMCFILLFNSLFDQKLPKLFRIIVFIINVLIILSTLFTKQHIIADVIGSFVLTLITYIITTIIINIRNKKHSKLINI